MLPNQERMRRWRNVMCPQSEPDAEIQAIDALEAELDAPTPMLERIRALISRIDPLSHYKAFENVDFLLNAIGDLDYPGSPAVDVLWRHSDMDEARRAEAKQYIQSLTAWLEGLDLDAAAEKYPACTARLQQTYAALGEMDEEKRWLVMCLRKTLKEHAYTPWDFIQEYDDEAFVCSVYEAILGRRPSPDDLKFRLEELQNGQDREGFFQEILQAPEHQHAHLYGVAAHLKHYEL